MSFLGGPVNLARSSTDFLLPFLRLPAVRFCLGFTASDGAVIYSEDIGAREFTINGAPDFSSDTVGLPRLDFDGAADYLSVADANWNSPTGAFTLFVALNASPAVAMRIVSKEPGGSNRAFELYYNDSTSTSITMNVNSDGTSGGIKSTTLANGAPGTGAKNFIVARYRPSTSIAIWGNGNVISDPASIPASVFNSTGAMEIGRRPAGTNYFDGYLYLVCMCAADIDTAHIATIQAHVRKWGFTA